MSDSKRSLRQRRVPKNFDSDNQDPDPYGYGRPPYHKDLRTPSQLLNSDAKLLVKLINSANKSKIVTQLELREHDVEQRRKEIENIKEPQPVRDRRLCQAQSSIDLQKRGIDSINHSKPQLTKKSKDIYNFKVNANNSDNQIPQKNEAFLNKIKTITMQSATNMRLLEMSMTKGRADTIRSQNQKMQGNGKGYKKGQDHGGFKQGTQQQNGKNISNDSTKNGFFSKDKEKIKQINEIEEKLGLQKSDFNNNKIFKRSAYHVAICYHIYLKKLREKGPIGNEIDPTYHARRLKEQMGRNL